MSDAEILAALSDLDALTLTIWGEARGEPLEGKAAVASVVMNRSKNPDRFADTIRDVCLQPKQFSCWNIGDPNRAKIMGMAERLRAGLLGTDSDGYALAECQFVATGYLKGILRSRVGQADHYLTRNLWGSSSRPSWANGTPEFVGSQVFMKAS